MKIACIYHEVDLDGWMSAAIVKHWFNIDNFRESAIGNTFSDSIDFIGYNYGKPVPNLSYYDKIIMCDISFPKEEMIKLYDKLNDNFIYIDHHISIIKELQLELDKGNIHQFKGLQHTEYAACELTWEYFFSNEKIPEIVRLLGRYDCFGHKGTSEETKVLEFQYGARQCISNYRDAYTYLLRNMTDINNDTVNYILLQGKSIYQYLCTEAKQTYKNGFEIEFNYPINDSIIKDSSIITHYEKVKFICINKERFNPINFGIDYHRDSYDGVTCFWYANDKFNFSLYNDNGLIDCSLIAKQFGGGGHKGASGFIIDIEQFKQLIK